MSIDTQYDPDIGVDERAIVVYVDNNGTTHHATCTVVGKLSVDGEPHYFISGAAIILDHIGRVAPGIEAALVAADELENIPTSWLRIVVDNTK